MLKAQPHHYHEPWSLQIMDDVDFAWMVKNGYFAAMVSDIETYFAEEEYQYMNDETLALSLKMGLFDRMVDSIEPWFESDLSQEEIEAKMWAKGGAQEFDAAAAAAMLR